MPQGKLVFAQLMLDLPLNTFRCFVAKQRGEHKVKAEPMDELLGDPPPL